MISAPKQSVFNSDSPQIFMLNENVGITAMVGMAILSSVLQYGLNGHAQIKHILSISDPEKLPPKMILVLGETAGIKIDILTKAHKTQLNDKYIVVWCVYDEFRNIPPQNWEIIPRQSWSFSIGPSEW